MAKLIDLSHPLIPGQTGFPTDPPLAITSHGTIATLGFNLSRIELGSHHGTHVDAMYHFFDDGRTIDGMPLEWFFGPARMLRILKGPNDEITADDLRRHETHLQPEAKIILDTGWHRRFGGDAFFTDHPSLSLEAADYLAGRRIRLLGIDMPTPSRKWLEFHRILLAADTEIVLVEALANLDALPDEFLFVGFPLNLPGGDGSPIRAVAVY